MCRLCTAHFYSSSFWSLYGSFLSIGFVHLIHRIPLHNRISISSLSLWQYAKLFLVLISSCSQANWILAHLWKASPRLMISFHLASADCALPSSLLDRDSHPPIKTGESLKWKKSHTTSPHNCPLWYPVLTPYWMQRAELMAVGRTRGSFSTSTQYAGYGMSWEVGADRRTP